MKRRDAIKRATFILGAGLSASTISGILAGCAPEVKGDVWQPSFLSVEQGSLLSEVVERIIPQTDTPGAKAVGVPDFIDKMLDGYYSEKEQTEFVAGLTEIEKAAREKHQKAFVDLNDQQKDKILTKFDEAAYAESDSEDRFFRWIKELTLSGFFLSEVGATEVLQYEHIPGEYKGCVPLAEVGNAWAYK